MTAVEFATLVHEMFKAEGWSTAGCELSGPFPTTTLDVWSRQVSERCTAARAEAVVCRLVRDLGVDPTKVRFSVHSGHLLVQYRDDLTASNKPLAARSAWRRLRK